MVGLAGDKRVLLWASLGEAFADEQRFVLAWLPSPEASALGCGVYFVRDKLYGMSGAVFGLVGGGTSGGEFAAWGVFGVTVVGAGDV